MLDDENTEAVYLFIREYIETHNFAPTVREVAKGCYLSRGTVLRHLDSLEAHGAIEREPGKARGMRLGARKPRFRHRRRRYLDR